MSPSIEDRLKAAYAAKTEQVTDARLSARHSERAEQLAALLSDDGPVTRLGADVLQPEFAGSLRSSRQSRWVAPLLAAAVVTAVTAGALAVAGSHGQRRPLPAPPASHLSTPAPAPTTAASTPSAKATPSRTGNPSTQAAPPYLRAGTTGSRAEIPWPIVGAGWRLLQPTTSSDAASSLYLYDPAGGRYLISDQVPARTFLTAWSPDGQRALYQSSEADNTVFRQLDLHTGQLDAGVRQFLGNFVSYTQPQGLAVVVQGRVQGAQRLLRYGVDGTLQLAYPPGIGTGVPLAVSALYTADGSQFVTFADKHSVLLYNSGDQVRQYPLPQPQDQLCQPIKWWNASTFLEACGYEVSGGFADSLYLQSAAGGAPTVLVLRDPATARNYDDAWPLSNGDVLLSRPAGCGVIAYDVLHPDGSLVGLVRPAGVPDQAKIINIHGDLATFQISNSASCTGGPHSALIDYNLVTGKTSTLLNNSGSLLSYPSP